MAQVVLTPREFEIIVAANLAGVMESSITIGVAPRVRVKLAAMGRYLR